MIDPEVIIHPLADVKSCTIGKGTHVWQFAIILEGAQIGEYCNINCHTFIESNTIIGDRVTVCAQQGTVVSSGSTITENGRCL